MKDALGIILVFLPFMSIITAFAILFIRMDEDNIGDSIYSTSHVRKNGCQWTTYCGSQACETFDTYEEAARASSNNNKNYYLIHRIDDILRLVCFNDGHNHFMKIFMALTVFTTWHFIISFVFLSLLLLICFIVYHAFVYIVIIMSTIVVIQISRNEIIRSLVRTFVARTK